MNGNFKNAPAKRKNVQVKKQVRFDSSQQWRLSRKQLKANAPNRSIIQKNLSAIKSGATPLKRAQAAYYGNSTDGGGGSGNKSNQQNRANQPNRVNQQNRANQQNRTNQQNRSPLLATRATNIKRERLGNAPRNITNTQNNDRKLPVHARLGARPAVTKSSNNRNESQNTKPAVQQTGNKQNAVQQLIAQKRALRLKTMQQNKQLRQLKAIANKTAGGSGNTSRNAQQSAQKAQQIRQKFKVNRTNFKPNLKQGNNNVRVNVNSRKRLGVKVGLVAAPSTADLCVSVANDLALKRQIAAHSGVTLINNNRRRLNRHVNEVDPLLQQEISLIQERSRRMKMDPTLSAVSGLNLNPLSAIHSYSTTNLLDEMKPTIITPMSQLGGITTSISVPRDNRQKLSLHERFSLL